MDIDEYNKKRNDIIERMFWVGCNPDNPEMFKKQAKEGFKLMEEMSDLYKTFKYSN